MSRVEIEWEPLTPEQTAVSLNGRGIYRPVTYPAWGMPIYDCHECLGWHAYVDVQDGQVVIVEWHAEDCELARGLCHQGMPPGATCEYCGAVNTDRPPEPEEDAPTCHGDLEPGAMCSTCGTINPNVPGEAETE
jgi:hypothetical protein